MNLCAFSVVLVLASEGLTLESIKYFGDGFGGFCQHRFQGHTWLQFAILTQMEDSVLEHCWHNNFIAGEFAMDLSASEVSNSAFQRAYLNTVLSTASPLVRASLLGTLFPFFSVS